MSEPSIKSLVERLAKMTDRTTRHDFDIGDWWNIGEEAWDALKRLERENTGLVEAIEQYVEIRDAAKPREAQPSKTPSQGPKAKTRPGIRKATIVDPGAKGGRFLRPRTTDKALLKLWGKVVVARDRFCRCGCGKPSQVGHHIFRRNSHPRLRFNLGNGLGLTHGCHKFKAHAVTDYRAWHEAIIGPTAWDGLFIAEGSYRAGKLDREAVRLGLEQELRRYSE